MPNFNTDSNGIKTLSSPPTGDAGIAVDGNFTTISALLNGKVVKVGSAVSGNVAVFSSGGSLADSGRNPSSFVGATGPQGSSGSAGLTGSVGAPGNTWTASSLFGSQPNTNQNAGDLYLDTSTDNVWQCNGGTSWNIQCNIMGSSGSTGSSGATGADGATGATGAQGWTGSTGFNGNDGATRAQGWTGPQGFNGNDGATGAQGWTGPQGFNGNDGATGATGPQGNDGETGPVGATGADFSPSGYSGFLSWTDNTGFSHSISTSNGIITSMS
jgi:hypothetical protein